MKNGTPVRLALGLLLFTFSFFIFHSAQAAHVYFNLSDFGLDTATHSNRITRLVPQSTPRSSGTIVVTSEARSFTNSPAATFLASNLVTGVYKVEIPGRWTTTTFNILVPDDSATYSATALITTTNSVPSASVGYSQAAADARFVNLTNHTSTILTVGTNLLRFTNECYVMANQNSNVVIVSGAGTASANGTYTQAVVGVWQKASTTNAIYNDGLDFLLTNNAGATLYLLMNTFPTSVVTGPFWTTVGGAAPAPSSVYDSVTNCFTVLASSAGLALPMVSSNLYVDAKIGNDSNALRGRIDRPWRNLQPALANQRFGDAILLGPGNYPELPAYGANFDVSNGVRLVGAGRGVTFIGTQGGADETIRCGSEVVLRGFTSYGLPNFGALGVISTNAYAEACTFDAAADSVYITDFETLLELRDCDLWTRYDGLADWSKRPGGSNRVIRLINCHIYGNNPLAGIIQGITGGDSRIEMYGGSIEVYNGTTRNTCITMDVDTFRTNKTGSVLLSNVRLRHFSASGLSLMVTNAYNLPVFMDNCTLEPFVPTALVNGTFTNGWEHRWVGIPNVLTAHGRTNKLVDTRSLTNALVAASEQGHEVTVFDAGGTAAGTNIIIAPSANQKITNSAASISITANYGSATLRIGPGTNWTLVGKTP